MKKKNYGTVLVSILLVGAVVGWTIFNSSQDPQPAVEYRAVCRNLPANAHWTSGGTRKEIPQTESSPNVWTPSPIGTYNVLTDNDKCYFVCDKGYHWDGTRCRAACETQEIEFSGFKIAACNVGATVAGTGKINGQDGCVTSANDTSCRSESIGDYFQRGNNYGFANSGTLLATTTTKPDVSGYGPNKPYSSSTFFIGDSRWASGSNYDLRGGSSSDGSGTIPTGQDAINRQGPCPAGWHVPSIGERNQLFIARAAVNGVKLSINDGGGYYHTTNTTAVTKFKDDFLLPLAGRRYYRLFANFENQGNGTTYLSSTDGYYIQCLLMGVSSVYINSTTSHSMGNPLRCFKNS